VKNQGVLLSEGGKGQTLHTLQRRKANWIRRILRRSCFLNMLLKERDRKTGKKTLETTGWRYGKEKILDLNSWWTRFGRDYGPIVKQTTN